MAILIQNILIITFIIRHVSIFFCPFLLKGEFEVKYVQPEDFKNERKIILLLCATLSLFGAILFLYETKNI